MNICIKVSSLFAAAARMLPRLTTYLARYT